MENKVKVWLARCNSGGLFLSSERPYKMENYWGSEVYTELDSSLFPSVKWEDDEPTEAYITLAETQDQSKQEQDQQTPKQEIDWEQRRYEIAKDILSTMFFHPKPAINRQEDINFAVKAADMLINKLKEKSK